MKRFLVICTAAVLALSACGRTETPAERAGQLAEKAFDAIEAAAAEGSDSLQVGNVAAEISDYIRPLAIEQESKFGEAFASKFYECSYMSGYGIEHTREQLLSFITTYLGIGENPDTAFGHAIAITMFSQCISESTEDPAEQAGRFAKEIFETLEIGQVFPALQNENGMLENIGRRFGEYCTQLTDEQAEVFGEAFATKVYACSEEYGYGEDFAMEFLQSMVEAITEAPDTESDGEIVGDSI